MCYRSKCSGALPPHIVQRFSRFELAPKTYPAPSSRTARLPRATRLKPSGDDRFVFRCRRGAGSMDAFLALVEEFDDFLKQEQQQLQRVIVEGRQQLQPLEPAQPPQPPHPPQLPQQEAGQGLEQEVRGEVRKLLCKERMKQRRAEPQPKPQPARKEPRPPRQPPPGWDERQSQQEEPQEWVEPRPKAAAGKPPVGWVPKPPVTPEPAQRLQQEPVQREPQELPPKNMHRNAYRSLGKMHIYIYIYI